MSEVEYDRMMDAVRKAVEPVPTEDSLARLLIFHQLPEAANDNLGFPWPMIPFPESWCFA